MKQKHFQVVVVGSGFAGSLIAMIACRLGFSTALIERGRHPHFVIGESSTPLANLLLEELADEFELSALRPLSKWGTWQDQLPQIGCGLKRGFTFYQHGFGKALTNDPRRHRQLLVGASPREAVADTHWYRPDFDHFFVRTAQGLGVNYQDETAFTAAVAETGQMRLTGTRHNEPVEVTAEFVLDATGPHGFLHRALGLPEQPFDFFPATQAVYSHFTNVGTLPDSFFCDDRTVPYPPEQAAVHHIFPGGWIWVLKFNNGITSAGAAATDPVANVFEFSRGKVGWEKLIGQLPALEKIFQPAEAVMPFVHHPRLAFRSRLFTGARWALLPYAAGFVDPLLSTGFPLALLGVKRMAELLKLHWGKPSFAAGLKGYAERTGEELEAAAQLVSSLYATMDRFELFRELSLLYFAAASFSETARRLGKPHFANGFLLCRDARFAEPFKKICTAARQPLSAAGSTQLKLAIRAAIEPYNVAGLTDISRHPYFPARTEDLLENAAKLGVDESEIRHMFKRCGLGGPDVRTAEARRAGPTVLN